MNFEFTTEQEILRKTVRQFVDDEIIPEIATWDAEGSFDASIWSRLAELGLMGVCVPEKYGAVAWIIMRLPSSVRSLNEEIQLFERLYRCILA